MFFYFHYFKFNGRFG
ncbi:hypothetical protein M3Y96_00435700 [Aphelenchoides besseyi]|nr:hypothetical protein M3Y96_00435700 [Aphelenchoides besseyi]